MANEIKFSLVKVPSIPISISQGVTFYMRWEIQYLGGPFPFYSTEEGMEDELLWDASFGIRSSFLDVPGNVEPYILGERVNIDEDSLLSGVFIEKATIDDVVHTYYGLYIIADDTTNLPATKLIYNIKLKRISDDWVIKIQDGICTVSPDIKALA